MNVLRGEEAKMFTKTMNMNKINAKGCKKFSKFPTPPIYRQRQMNDPDLLRKGVKKSMITFLPRKPCKLKCTINLFMP